MSLRPKRGRIMRLMRITQTWAVVVQRSTTSYSNKIAASGWGWLFCRQLLDEYQFIKKIMVSNLEINMLSAGKEFISKNVPKKSYHKFQENQTWLFQGTATNRNDEQNTWLLYKKKKITKCFISIKIKCYKMICCSYLSVNWGVQTWVSKHDWGFKFDIERIFQSHISSWLNCLKLP